MIEFAGATAGNIKMTPENFNSRSPFHRVGLYLLFLSVLGIAGGALVYTSVMQYLGWSAQPGALAFSVSLSQKPHLSLYRSPHTERYLSTVGGDYAVLLKPWREFASEEGLGLKELTSLDGVPSGGNNVLVLPSAIALDAAERAAILRYRELGGAVVLSWASGSRGGAGEWQGWDFIRQLTDVKVQNDTKKPAVQGLTVGEGAVTQAFPAGSRFVLSAVAEQSLTLTGGHVALALPPDGQPAGTSDATLPDVPSEGLVVVNELGASQTSRVAVLGMAETAWARSKADMHGLLREVLNWMVRVPVVARSQWPDGQRAAALVATDVPQGMTDLSRVTSALNRAQLPGSIFLPLGLDTAADAALRGTLFGWDVGYWKAETDDLSAVRTSVVNRGGAKAWAGLHALGSAGLGALDQTLFDAGGRYRLGGEGESKAALPALAPVNGQKPGKRLVVLPAARSHLDPAPWLALTVGGVGGFSWPASELMADNNGAVSSWAERMRRPMASPVWFANAAQIADWWLDRERFQLRARYLGARTEIDVSVLGDAPFDHGALIVVLPYKGRMPVVKGLKSGMPTPKVSLLDGYRALIRFDRMAVGDYSYQLTY